MWTRRSLLVSGAAAWAGRARGAAGGYAEALALSYGGAVDPKAGRRQAMAEVRRVRDRADLLLKRQGLERGPVAERIAALFDDGQFLYPDDDTGRDRAVFEMNARLAAMRPKLARAFGDLAIPAAQVRRMSPADEARARGGYRDPPAYYVDLVAIGERPAWTLASVAFHETVPGHAMQTSMQVESSQTPTRAPAYSEAWAIYAEQLCADLGAYDGDPLGELGYLHWRLFRMARIVADTGRGALGWSGDRAAAAMTTIQGHPIAFATIAADVARMQTSPGLYAAQGLGALAIARLRPRDVARWPAFHRAVLADGRCPGAWE